MCPWHRCAPRPPESLRRARSVGPASGAWGLGPVRVCRTESGRVHRAGAGIGVRGRRRGGLAGKRGAVRTGSGTGTGAGAVAVRSFVWRRGPRPARLRLLAGMLRVGRSCARPRVSACPYSAHPGAAIPAPLQTRSVLSPRLSPQPLNWQEIPHVDGATDVLRLRTRSSQTNSGNRLVESPEIKGLSARTGKVSRGVIKAASE